MRGLFCLVLFLLMMVNVKAQAPAAECIRINQLGYLPGGIKVAVWASSQNTSISNFEMVDAFTGKTVFKGKTGKAFGAYGPFKQTYRLNFTDFKRRGKFILKAGSTRSAVITIHEEVYKGAADFCLRYMRQQRSGFNPFLNDSCHTYDGYTLYGPMPDSSFVDVSGGWHDASDYLQYATTSANATYHLLMAWRDFPGVFSDQHLSNGLQGKNGMADVLDEAKWGLSWLLKMHPRKDWMFNQIADDRDHISMRIPKLDSQYGKGYERPVYFLTGEPQQRGKFMNNTTGTSSTAAKFTSAFALGAGLFEKSDRVFSELLKGKAFSAYEYSLKKPGVSQTASVRSPYIYAEENWKDDMELSLATLNKINEKSGPVENLLSRAMIYAKDEPITPWLGNDTANHYQWYPFINIGHYELAKQLKGKDKQQVTAFYQLGIIKLWQNAKQNAFYRGIPFIWCSNNLTTSFAIQCKWYRQLSGDIQYLELEQANIDWLFGCNPWGTGMVYGLPSTGDTPEDPHSAFTHLKKYPIDGGLVDGPVYTSIYKNLIGISLNEPDEYEPYQSNLAVYHDDYGDYSTNEPTMDGTASLIYLLAACETEGGTPVAIIRGDSSQKKIALIFSGHEYANGGEKIIHILRSNAVKASFFFTGDFYRNRNNHKLIASLRKDGHYLGAHSDKHLLYNDWKVRDSLLVSRELFMKDFSANQKAMAAEGINTAKAKYFLPPFEWYNDSIVSWVSQEGKQLINYTPGTLSHADYTINTAVNFRSNATILASILEREADSGLNGNILLFHFGVSPLRKEPFFDEINTVINLLKSKGYQFEKIDELL
jgi:endoglucanase